MSSLVFFVFLAGLVQAHDILVELVEDVLRCSRTEISSVSGDIEWR